MTTIFIIMKIVSLRVTCKPVFAIQCAINNNNNNKQNFLTT